MAGALDRVGLSEPGAFDGLGLRGNASRPITADGVVVPADAILAALGTGRADAMLRVLQVKAVAGETAAEVADG